MHNFPQTYCIWVLWLDIGDKDEVYDGNFYFYLFESYSFLEEIEIKFFYQVSDDLAYLLDLVFFINS